MVIYHFSVNSPPPEKKNKKTNTNQKTNKHKNKKKTDVEFVSEKLFRDILSSRTTMKLLYKSYF